MKSLSQSEYGELRSLYESVYAPKFESILDEFTDEDLDDLTDEYIEEQVTEFFNECLEEGLDIEILEETICESIDSELELLSEVTNPAKVAALRAKNKVAAAAGEGSGDAGAKARARLNVSKQKVSGSSEKKASALSRIKGAVKKVGKAVQGGVGLAARAVSTAQRAGSAVKSAAKKGYERGKKGSGSESSTDSSTPSSSSSSGESSTYSSTPSSSSSSSGTSAAPKKRKDGLLKRGLKKLVRGVGKAASVGAGAVKAGADYVTDRARKEQMNYNDIATIQELYNQMYAPQDVEEVYKGKHGQSDKEYADSRSQGGKMVSGDSKQSGAEYTHGRRVKAANPGMQPDVGGKTKPKSQGKMDRGTRADLEYRKANLKKEELEAIGEDSRRMSNKQHTQRVRSNIKSFGSNYTPPSNYDPDANRGQGEVLTRKQIEKKRRKSLRQEEFDAFDVVLEFLQVEGYAETLEEAEWIMANLIDEEAIDIIHEIDENRRMARDPEGRKSGHSKQPDPSKPGFTGMGNMSIDQIRKMSARIEKEKTKKEEAEYVDENRRAARAAGGSKDDSKKQPDPSKPGFTGIGNMSIDQIRKMSARIEKDKKEEFEAWFDEVLEAYKEPNLGKMRNQEDRHRKAAVKQRGGSRGSSKNRSMKMSSIRGALERGEDPRADGYGGKRAERGNPPEDHRAAFSKNPLNNPPRRVKKPGV